jgi:hypothetical protein
MADLSKLMVPTTGDEVSGNSSRFSNNSMEIIFLVFEKVSAMFGLSLALADCAKQLLSNEIPPEPE